MATRPRSAPGGTTGGVVKQQISRQRQTTQLQIKTLARAATAHNSTHPQGECAKSACLRAWLRRSRRRRRVGGVRHLHSGVRDGRHRPLRHISVFPADVASHGAPGAADRRRRPAAAASAEGPHHRHPRWRNRSAPAAAETRFLGSVETWRPEPGHFRHCHPQPRRASRKQIAPRSR